MKSWTTKKITHNCIGCAQVVIRCNASCVKKNLWTTKTLLACVECSMRACTLDSCTSRFKWHVKQTTICKCKRICDPSETIIKFKIKNLNEQFSKWTISNRFHTFFVWILYFTHMCHLCDDIWQQIRIPAIIAKAEVSTSFIIRITTKNSAEKKTIKLKNK